MNKLFVATLLAVSSVQAMSSRQAPPPENPDKANAYIEEVDLWYGPGYYYGTWFENEDDYREWRRHHLDYPSNRDYYHPARPIEYRRESRSED
ncbi:MAG: hypothetical protein KGJ02_05335 [Verrucomicrobiota bacterium]|nr:hypothetical protein [Verrucomicrobiota bacterium]